MAEETPEQTKPDYERLTHIPILMRMHNEGQPTPYTQAIEQDLLPHAKEHKAGKISDEEYLRRSAEIALKHAHAYMGGRIPDQKEADAYAEKEFHKAAPSYGVDTSKNKATADKAAPNRFAEAYRLIGHWQKLAGTKPPTTEAPAEKPAAEPAAVRGKTGPTAPAGSTGVPPPATDDEKLVQAHLLLMRRLAESKEG